MNPPLPIATDCPAVIVNVEVACRSGQARPNVTVPPSLAAATSLASNDHEHAVTVSFIGCAPAPEGGNDPASAVPNAAAKPTRSPLTNDRFGTVGPIRSYGSHCDCVQAS
jgi:hypothetical protein